MKTETQITQEKINEYRIRKEGRTYILKEMLQHKEDSQRFLDFLEDLRCGCLIEKVWDNTKELINLMHPIIQRNVDRRRTDLKQAIKLYNEAEI